LKSPRAQSSFDAVPWPEIATRFHKMAAAHEEFRHMAEIVDSIVASGAGEVLAGYTSMHDLVVAPRPVDEPPDDVVRVCAPSSSRPVAPSWVRIEHVTATGRDDRIDRPTSEAVSLFWRFMIEKFGVRPDRSTRPVDGAEPT